MALLALAQTLFGTIFAQDADGDGFGGGILWVVLLILLIICALIYILRRR